MTQGDTSRSKALDGTLVTDVSIRIGTYCLICIFSLVVAPLFSDKVIAQTREDTPVSPTNSPDPPSSGGRPGKALIGRKIARDQKEIWKAPILSLRENYKLILPLAIATAALIATDRFTSRWVDSTGTLQPMSRHISRGGGPLLTMTAVGGLYIAGKATHSERLQRTGLLAAEALVDATLVTQALKLATGRQRPRSELRHGRFFEGGVDFPSGHTAAAWAVATVVASQYDHRRLIKYGAFIAAAAIGFARYSGGSHFLSDVLTGGAIGFGIGRYVYRRQ